MKRRLTSGIAITILFVACGREAIDGLGGALEDAGRMLSDAASGDASAQPLTWKAVNCVEEPSYTRTVVVTSATKITTTTETFTPYAYAWEGEPEEWLVRSRANLYSNPCYPYDLPGYQDLGYACDVVPSNPNPAAFNVYTGHPTSNGAGELRVECGRETETRKVVTDLAGTVQSDETTVTPYDPTVYDYWTARR